MNFSYFPPKPGLWLADPTQPIRGLQFISQSQIKGAYYNFSSIFLNTQFLYIPWRATRCCILELNLKVSINGRRSTEVQNKDQF